MKNLLLAEGGRQFGKSYLLQVTKNPPSLVSVSKFVFFVTRSYNGILHIETNIKSIHTSVYRNIKCNISVNAACRPSGCFALHFYEFFLASCWISYEFFLFYVDMLISLYF